MSRKKKSKFKRNTSTPKKPFKSNHSKTAKTTNPPKTTTSTSPPTQTLKQRFPFWVRLKICKNRTTLIIDEEQSIDKKLNKVTDNYIHREATSKERKGLEKIDPNPDKSKKEPMYLKRPAKLPKKMFKPHNKELTMPQHLKDRYDKNNDKKDK